MDRRAVIGSKFIDSANRLLPKINNEALTKWRYNFRQSKNEERRNGRQYFRFRLFVANCAIVSSHVGNNSITTDALPALITFVHAALANVGNAPADVVLAEPAVPIKKSVFPGYIVCLEDGKKLKMLKRHLRTAYNMTPDEYRAEWGLPSNYPMVAPDFAEKGRCWPNRAWSETG